ncbi:MAG: hypothetical protein AAF441_01720 [Pseudomonadota bacterium]
MGKPARSYLIRKPEVVVPEKVIEEVTGAGPSDAVAVASTLPEAQRAVVAKFCYGRRHLRHLGLEIAGTLSKQSLMETFGGAWEVVHKQASDPERTLAAEKRPASEQGRRGITLATVGTTPPPSVNDEDDWDEAEEDGALATAG